jgi:hypothetical protein
MNQANRCLAFLPARNPMARSMMRVAISLRISVIAILRGMETMGKSNPAG